MGQVTLRYWAAARAAAGVDTEVIDVDGPLLVRDLIAAAVRRHPEAPRLRDVLGMCSVLVGDRPLARSEAASMPVEPGASVEFLPPFAGG